MSQEAAGPASREFYHVVMRLARALGRAGEDIAWETGITVAEFNVLLVLGEGVPLSSAQVARRAFMTPQASHQLVTGLLARGVVESQPHPTDDRVRLVSLTDAGWDILHNARQALHALQDRATSRLTFHDRVRFEEALTTIAETIQGGWFGDIDAEALAAEHRAGRGAGDVPKAPGAGTR
ncbi:MAG: MarR family winged helix-turn-helix transcriptional regulator [Pseudolysinimonas sp.]|uniref:MarR family winged helix-turn-helix transcriptional regulator n=1 Tax=Pseudolysinimonas sp. TaxID=2680009 RepID=UPI003265C596